MDELSGRSRDLLAKFSEEVTPSAQQGDAAWAKMSGRLSADGSGLAAGGGVAGGRGIGLLAAGGAGVAIVAVLWLGVDRAPAGGPAPAEHPSVRIDEASAQQTLQEVADVELAHPRLAIIGQPSELVAEEIVGAAKSSQSDSGHAAGPALAHPPASANRRGDARGGDRSHGDRSSRSTQGTTGPNSRSGTGRDVVDAPTPARDDLGAEIALMAEVRAAVKAGRHARALALLGRHGQEFPGGVLLEQAAALEVDALCGVGRREQARRAVERFLRRWPGSPSASRIRQGCT